MNTPDTYAGGQFGLPLRVAGLVRLAESTHSKYERQSVVEKLWRMGWFLDKIGIIWPLNKVPPYIQEHGGYRDTQRKLEAGDSNSGGTE